MEHLSLFKKENSALSEYENLVLSSELIMVELPPLEIWKDDVSGVSPLSEFETSGVQIFQGGNN